MNNHDKMMGSEDLKKIALEIEKHDENEEFKINDDLKIFKSNFDSPNQLKVPRNTIILAFFLSFLGFVLIVTGFVVYSKYYDVIKCLAYWIIGAFCAIPGFFYVGKIIKYWRSQNDEEKLDIMKEMPLWN